ncbi:MAG: hypothetical protein A3B31_00015 [Candidatus Komeilibacteria bacterium RIFCSPLOWO2_01_FULL_53_11]|uniref:Uncharacterized protein n=1 Tax=Candidatus Komeilibacteria bacterium RIFCSPLOWO2_01_FULL_53_11 TaxID=1798552 RepID=A0A1G2BUB5_9BACT|nr:MAG: hypothetical protein A3B31_00015 [Candidatus Komeilibacteria bacterium RIFCSPLOWO2_01_FULL_53_11]
MPNTPIQLDKSMLERGYWLATHRLVLKKWTSIGLYILIVFSYLYFFVQFGVYMYHYNEWQEIMAQSIATPYAWADIQAANAPLDLEVTDPHLFARGDNRYDAVAQVHNPNEQWGVESFQYAFAFSDGSKTESTAGYVVPGETKFLTKLNFSSQTPLSRIADVEVSDVRWKKIVRLPALSWIFTEPPEYLGSQVISDKGVQRVLPQRITWSVRNGSTLSIRTVVWQVALYTGSQLNSVINYQTGDFPYFAERHFEIILNSATGRVSSITVNPLVNIFDPGYTYLP